MNYLLSVICVLAFISCKESKKDSLKERDASVETIKMGTKKYPEALRQVFDAHGGLQKWKSEKSLVFEISKPDYTEVHTIDLHSRKDRVTTPDFSMGYDGNRVWLLDEKDAYKGNAGFYHNLMFYFYAMPFVLADEGTVYGTAEDLIFEEKRYPGVSVQFNSGVGASDKDQYYIHYDPDTHQMAWLGYTVTYMSGEKSNDFHWIRYNDWMDVNGLLLPKSLTWYAYKDGAIKEPKNTVVFENAVLSTVAKPTTYFMKPAAAHFVENK